MTLPPGRTVLLPLLLLLPLAAGCGRSGSGDDPGAAAAPTATVPPAAAQPAAAASQPAAPAAAASRPASRPASAGDPTVAEFIGLRGPKPATWEAYPPENSMRAANYHVPGDAELVVFYFGQGMGGSIEGNIDRWAGQFVGLDGGPVEPEVDHTEVDGMRVTLVELQGGYMGMTSTVTPDQLFLAAIVEAPAGNVFIRLVGPTETVEASRDEYTTLVEGLRKTGG